MVTISDDNAHGRWSQTSLLLVLRVWACDDKSREDSSTFTYPSFAIKVALQSMA